MRRTLVFSDLHGCYDLWEGIKAELKEDDKVYCLGDCADRGTGGYQIMKEVIADPRITYLKGNHEVMMLDAMRQGLKDCDSWSFIEAYSLMSQNGGEPTYDAWANDNFNTDVVEALEKLPYITRLVRHDGKTILLSHSGYEPEYDDTRDEIAKRHNDEENYEVIWNRNHFIGDKYWGNYDYVIHGHTPIQYMIEEINNTNRFCEKEETTPWNGGAYIYQEGHKINLDSLSVVNNQAVLFDLDTFESIIIKGNGDFSPFSKLN